MWSRRGPCSAAAAISSRICCRATASQTTLVDGRDLDAWRAAVKPNTRVFFFETPTNPVLELVDIAGVSAIAKKAGALVVVDNVFATPLLQRPMQLGADIVVYSATKHIDGQGRCLGGVVLGPKEFIEEKLHNYLKHTGPSLSPFNAWVLLKGLETLTVRVERQCASAAAIADFLAGRSEVARVYYPGRADHPQAALAKRQMAGGGPMVAFEVKGGKEAAFRFMNALSIFKISNNLGDAKSLITHPATTTHQRLTPEVRAELGIFDNSLRLSIGLEDVERPQGRSRPGSRRGTMSGCAGACLGATASCATLFANWRPFCGGRSCAETSRCCIISTHPRPTRRSICPPCNSCASSRAARGRRRPTRPPSTAPSTRWRARRAS